MRSLVFKCPETDIDILINIDVQDRAVLLLEDSPFTFLCHCCQRRHLWRLRDARHVKRDDKAA
jgi:hypothetical protein